MAYFIKNKGFAFFGIFLFFCACKKDTQSALSTEITSPTNYDLNCIKFMNQDIGFACGGSQFSKSELIKTIDGGETWTIISLPQNVESKQLFSLDISETGTLHTVGFGGVTHYSTDTGRTIIFQQEPRWAHWRSVCFRTPQSAMACGREGLGAGKVVPLTAQDNWQYPWDSSSHTFAMYHITFADSMVGFISGFGAITKTTDGGKTWNFTPAKNDYFTGTTWFSRSSGVAIGWEGLILKTTDGGENWAKIKTRKKGFKSIAKNQNDELIIVGENGCILYSNDKGSSWKEIESETDTNFESVFFREANTFFAVGNGGRIFKFEL